MKPLGTIEEERLGCVATHEAHPYVTAEWCHWHDKLVTLKTPTETWQQRIEIILTQKPEAERAVRLRNFRPVVGRLPADCRKADADLNKTVADRGKTAADLNKAAADLRRVYADHSAELIAQYDHEWPDNTWNGKSIFPEDARENV